MSWLDSLVSAAIGSVPTAIDNLTSKQDSAATVVAVTQTNTQTQAAEVSPTVETTDTLSASEYLAPYQAAQIEFNIAKEAKELTNAQENSDKLYKLGGAALVLLAIYLFKRG